MQVSLSRRALFTGRSAKSAQAPIRPPWSVAESAFLDLCTQCGECRDACAEGIIRPAGGGFPEIDFLRGECTFCGDCAQVCEPGALVAADVFGALPWDRVAKLDAACLSQNGVTCRVCGDRCDARAIRFQLAVGGVAHPIIDTSTCTGCGACVAPCPVGAIKIVDIKDQVQMEEPS